LSGATRAIADSLGVKNIAVTITHDGNTAIAQVIFES
jgi:phosphopantetheinyl transferase (holo-ACP synthase)